MRTNRTAQLMYQTFYVTLGLIGTVASLGIFDNINNIRWDFYVHFTNLSNFLCIGVMLAGLIQTAKKKEDIKWNFTKFLVDREGNVVQRFEPTESLDDVKAAVKELL